jgi:aerobic carbon-monoxide dehydrogenase large subunit
VRFRRRVTLVHGDTDQVASGAGTYASRSLQLGGSALHQAALALRERARELAAGVLRVDEREVMLDRSTGRWHAGNDATTGLAWSDLAALHPGLSADGKYGSAPTVPFGAHLALSRSISTSARFPCAATSPWMTWDVWSTR